MDGRKLRIHDDHAFSHTACALEPHRQTQARNQLVFGLQRPVTRPDIESHASISTCWRKE